MPSQIGRYQLQRTLGTGANSKVKLGVHLDTGNKSAIKILKKQDPRVDANFLNLLMTEVETMSKLSHPNIVNMYEYSKDAFVEKDNGTKYPVVCIALELAEGGELFDYVALGGAFSERTCRYYFRQLLDGLDYVHQKGVSHRDLKPENLLFDKEFNLKIADFGFAAPVAGRDGSGYLKTKLGTESYMSPEIHARRPYIGPSVDLFAAAIILFIMYTQHPPFTRAEPTDPFYRLICANRADLFWKAHSKNKPNGAEYFSEEFKNLITGLLQFDPATRPQMADVLKHPWVNKDDCATLAEIHADFANRKNLIDAENEVKRQQKEIARQQAQHAAGGGAAARKQYRTVGTAHRGNDESKAEEIKHELRILDKYIPGVPTNTQFFSTMSPQELLGEINGVINDRHGKTVVDPKKYKLKA